MQISPQLKVSGRYLALLGMLWLVVFCMLQQGLVLAIALVTLGLGLLLIFALVVATFYLTMALPAAFSWNGKRWPFIMVALVSVSAFAAMPHIFGQREASEILASAGPDLMPPKAPMRSLQIQLNQEYIAGFEVPENSCGPECTELLKTGQLDWLRIVAPTGGTVAQQHTKFKAGHGAECASPGFPATPDTACIFQMDDDATPAQYQLEITPQSGQRLASLQAKARWSRLLTWLTVTGKPANAAVNYRQSQIAIDIPALPTMPTMPTLASFGFEGPSGFSLTRLTTTTNRLSLSRVLNDLGFTLSPPAAAKLGHSPTDHPDWMDGLNADVNRQLLAVLDRKGSADFDRQEVSVINNWTMYARDQKTWTPELLALAVRVVADERLKTYTYIDQVFANSDATRSAMLPAVLNRALGDTNETSIEAYSFIVANDLETTKPEILIPYADQIVTLAKRPGRVGVFATRSLGRLNFDPTPLLAPFDAPNALGEPLPRLEAACYADTKWSASLVPELQKSLAALRGDPKQSQLRDMIRAALVAQGAFDAAAAEPGLSERELRLLRMRRDDLSKYARPDCRSLD